VSVNDRVEPIFCFTFLIVSIICKILTINDIVFFASQRHHYDHHTKFNYNYGSSQLFDVLCGTTFEDYSSRKSPPSATMFRGTGGRNVAPVRHPVQCPPCIAHIAIGPVVIINSHAK
jgi:hypothetical protein